MGKDKGFSPVKEKKKKDKHSGDANVKMTYDSISPDEEKVFYSSKKDKKKDRHRHEDVDSSFEGQRVPPRSPKKKSKKDREESEDVGSSSPKKKSKKVREDMTTDPPMVGSIKNSMFDHETVKKSKKKKRELEDRLDKVKSDSEKEDKEAIAETPSEVVPTSVTADQILEEEFGWSKEDFAILIDNIEKGIPPNDSQKFDSRVQHIKWDEVKFKDYSAEFCKETWLKVQKRMRRYRLLKEIISDAKQWLENPWFNFYGSNKNNRHPDLPKRPLTSYMLYFLEKKDRFVRKNPNVGIATLSKIIGNKFHQLSDSKKAKYVERAKQLREEYHEKMKKFTEMHPNSKFVTQKKVKDEKHSEMPGPTKPLSPIKLFIEEKLKNYDESDGMSRAECIAQIKEQWKHLGNKKKVHWIRWSQSAEKKYLEELEVYKSQNPNFEMPKYKSILSKEEISILERMEGKPEKPPNSAYSLFSRLMLKDDQLRLISFSPKERLKEISRLWAAVSDDEKKQYAEKAKKMTEAYKLEYATYLDSLPEDKRIEELARTMMRKKRKTKEVESTSGGKKLKQTKLPESFHKNVAEKQESVSDEADETEDEAEESEKESVNDPKQVEEIMNRICLSEPPKPCEKPFELFKEIYLTNPANKPSRARLVWNSMPSKEKDRYRKKLEAQKQNYMIKYSEFLKKLEPHELRVFSSMKRPLPVCNNGSSDGTSDDEEDSDDSDEEEDVHHRVQTKLESSSHVKAEKSSASSSEESD